MRAPRVERQADGTALLVDGLGQGHTPRALIATIAYLADQRVVAQLQDEPRRAAELTTFIQQRRTWVRWLESGIDYPLDPDYEVPHV